MAKTIAWIEDDTDIIDPLVEPLEDAGYKFIRLRTAKQALQEMKRLRDVDLILLDMLVREGDAGRQFSEFPGLDILSEIRTVHKFDTPVVVLTVVKRDDVRRNLQKLGVSDIITKPVKPSELKERVEKVLKLKTPA